MEGEFETINTLRHIKRKDSKNVNIHRVERTEIKSHVQYIQLYKKILVKYSQ